MTNHQLPADTVLCHLTYQVEGIVKAHLIGASPAADWNPETLELPPGDREAKITSMGMGLALLLEAGDQQSMLTSVLLRLADYIGEGHLIISVLDGQVAVSTFEAPVEEALAKLTKFHRDLTTRLDEAEAAKAVKKTPLSQIAQYLAKTRRYGAARH